MLYVRQKLWSSSGLLIGCDTFGGNTGEDAQGMDVIWELTVLVCIYILYWSSGFRVVCYMFEINFGLVVVRWWCVICSAGTPEQIDRGCMEYWS